MKKLVCEMCNSTDIIKENGLFVCQYCGCKYAVEEAKKMMNDDGPVEVTVIEPIKIVNNEFESKLAEAENWAHMYFSRGKDAVVVGTLFGYDAVNHYFTSIESIGANESKYWEKRAEFMCEGFIFATKTGEKNPAEYNKDSIARNIATCMDFAIKYADEKDKERLLEKKDDLISRFNHGYHAGLSDSLRKKNETNIKNAICVMIMLAVFGFFEIIAMMSLPNEDKVYFSPLIAVSVFGIIGFYVWYRSCQKKRNAWSNSSN